MRKPGKNTSSTLLGHSAAIFLIRLAPALAAMAALVLFSRYTQAAFYGSYQTFWVQWQVLNTIACLGLPALIFTYPLAHINGLIYKIKPMHRAAFGCWIVFVGGAFSGLQLATAQSLVHPTIAFLFLSASVPVALCEVYLMLGRKFSFVAVSSIFYSVLFVVAHVLFLRHTLNITQLFLLIIACNALRLCLLAVAARTLYKTTFETAPALRMKSIRSLWFHLAIYDGVQMLFRWVDKLVLGFLLAAPAFALYFNGTVDVPFLPLLLGAAGSAMLIQLSHGGDDRGRISLLKESGCILSRIVFPVFFFLILFRQELFGMLFKHHYDGATELFFISSLVIPLRAYNFTSILQHKGKGRIINTGAVLDLAVALLLAGPLYLLTGLEGIALSFVISTYLQAGYYLVKTARIMRVKPWELLPLRAWFVQLIGFFIGFIGLYYLLHWYFHEGLVLFLGTGTLMFTIILALLPVLLSKRKSDNVPQL